MASFVGKGGGLWDRSVNESDRMSRGRRTGVKERVWRSRSVPSVVCVRAEEINSSLCGLPDQSPELGRAFGLLGSSGD